MNKKLLTSAVGAALGFIVTVPAMADHMSVVPYVVKDTNRTTVVTLIGDGVPVSAGAHVHLQYWTKSTTDANTAACAPSSVFVPFTDNDIMTFDTAGILGYPLFGDTTNPAPLGTSISYAAPRHGFLTIDNQSDNLESVYWLEIDLANGGAHGDIAVRSVNNANFNGDPGISGNGYVTYAPWAGPSYDGNNSIGGVSSFNSLHVGDRTDLSSLTDGTASVNEYGTGTDRAARAVAFWPSSIASSAFTVTPMGTDMLNKENNQVVLQVLNSNNVQGAYDRNENGVDGTVPVTVRCVGRVTPAQLMPGVVNNAAWAATGGWGFLANLGDADTNYSEGGTSDLRAIVYQVDTSSAGGKFMSNATRIVSSDF